MRALAFLVVLTSACGSAERPAFIDGEPGAGGAADAAASTGGAPSDDAHAAIASTGGVSRAIASTGGAPAAAGGEPSVGGAAAVTGHCSVYTAPYRPGQACMRHSDCAPGERCEWACTTDADCADIDVGWRCAQQIVDGQLATRGPRICMEPCHIIDPTNPGNTRSPDCLDSDGDYCVSIDDWGRILDDCATGVARVCSPKRIEPGTDANPRCTY